MPSDLINAFLTESVRGRIGRAGQLLGQDPAIAEDVRAAVALGDAERVAAALEHDPELAVRRDPHTGWTALHLACASRWHRDPARADGLRAIVGLLLDAGADLELRPSEESQWSPLRCAVASTTAGRGNEPIVRLLLDRGATVGDEDLYLAGFAAGGEQWCVRLLAEHTPDVRAVAEKALAAPISQDDADGVRVLLAGRADPGRYRDDDGRSTGVVLAALGAGCGPELIEALLSHGADPNQAGADGRSAFAVATANGRGDLLDLLRRHGARDDATALDHLRYACLTGDRAGALRLLDEHPGLRAELAEADGSALVGAAEAGNTAAVGLLLEAGFPVAAPGGANGGTALHAAAWAGSVDVVRLCVGAGAPLEARDATWHATPLQWALVGSAERPTGNPAADWVGTVRVLLDAGASTSGLSVADADPAVVAVLSG
jgi:ankyrin repeat protein